MAGLNEVFWIEGEPAPGLAIVLRPRGSDWLEDELKRMKRGGLHTLVSLLEPEESNELGLSEEQPLAERIGLTFVSFPIPDRHVPTRPNAFREFVFGLAIRLRAGERVGMHCRGSIGRATVTAACTLIEFGWEPEKALNAIEAARGCPVPDTPEQREWILRYKARS